jgi:hypothetical protein
VDGDKYSSDYAIRASLELGGKDSNLCLHYGLRNCKGYNAEEGKTLLDKKFKIRICACEENKEQANSRKARRIELKDVDVRVALKAPPSKDCSRFLNGICLKSKPTLARLAASNSKTSTFGSLSKRRLPKTALAF